MTMRYFDKMLLAFLLNSKLKMEVTGFDMDSFEKLLRDQLKRQLEAIEYIVFASEFISDAERVEAIRDLFYSCN